ncbi:MAG: ankyrin repeat domain-containing protein, partial [Campylobacterota bacterium]|nr:ankyrin repeat domain-containing protein [Campylobacterota bacterium]
VNNNTILMELVSISSKIYKENQEKRESLIKMSKQLLKNGLDSNAIDDNGETALFRAVRVEDFELVTFLLSAGIDPNIQNNNSQSVLHLAIYQGINSLDIINCLLKYGANPLIKNKQNQTIYEILNDIILHTHGKKDIYDHFILARIKQDGQYMVVLESILSHNKADLNFQDSTGNPLFFNPLLNDHFSLFKLYIKNGLNIHNINILNHNIFFEYVLNAFEQNKEDIDFQNNISMLISSKLNHNCQDETGWTIVHKILTKECNIHLFDILTQVVLFDYEITDKLGRSVIHNAVWGDQKSAMKRIHSIDKSIVNIADGYGILPITYAALLGSQDLVLLLISLGANVRSGLSISDSAIKKFSPLLKNLDSLKNNIKDDDMLRKMDIVIDQVKRDFNLI